MDKKISLTGLSGKALDFASLFNNMIDADWGMSFAASTAAQVISENLNVKCDCK